MQYDSDGDSKGNGGAGVMGWPVGQANFMVLAWRLGIGLSKKPVERDNTTINRTQYDSDSNGKGNGSMIDKRWQNWRDDNNGNNNIDDDYDK